MIYDCFPFFNELDLLEIRLNELNDHVDRFVLVEATKTYQKKDKPLYFKDNQKRFEKFLPRINHVVVDQFPGFFYKWRKPRTWDFENSQRDQILRGLTEAAPEDDIIISDVDEIPRVEMIKVAQEKKGIKVFRQKMFYYYLDCFVQDYPEPHAFYQGYKPWNGTVMLKKKDIKTITKARTSRGFPEPQITAIQDGGWHYSFLGGTQKVIQKLEAYSHTEHNLEEYKDPRKVEQALREGRDILGRDFKMHFIDPLQDCPKFLKNNFDRYRHLTLNYQK